MRLFAFLLAALALLGVAAATTRARPVNAVALLGPPQETLAAYRLFTDGGARAPNAGVTPYDLNNALYADGAMKFRYVFIPPGARASYSADDVFEFPVGAALIKTFAIAADMRRPAESVRYLETRLLIRQRAGWVAFAYVWNEDQTEARLAPIGAEVPVQWIDEAGATVALNWRVPNRNQCKGCHDRDGRISPIGPTARNLNKDHLYRDGATENQLVRWAAFLDGAPAPSEAPRAPASFDAASGPLDARARAYLDVNCAHCHNPHGPASVSGLDLRAANPDPVTLGIRKRPIAAGRGAGERLYAIAPGRPDASILLYRMQSLEPGIMMPELGRQHTDGAAIALIREWVAGMDAPR
ncbi:MAG: hypothetical protein JNJ73_18130 [Hyphomonadaceae bacterium]|nr:hypothetical protein [Hyphomonadaceae bacterium]